MLSRFFIDRPIFANVIAILTVLIGAVAMFVLPVEQYPQVTPPTVQVSTNYPGADAKVLSDTVASPIEQEVNGVEQMLYMSSNCSSDGTYTLTVTFDVGTNLDMAQVLVQNRVAIAMPKLPEEVQRQGVTTKKQSTSILLVATLFSPDDRYDSLFLSNFGTLRVKDALSRIYGCGDVSVRGAGMYSMRVWLSPEKLRARNLTTQDVLAAIREQNVQVAAGQVGQPPIDDGQNFQFSVRTLGRLSDTEQFEDIIVKTASDGQNEGRITRVKDVARVELGGQVYDSYSYLDGKPSASIVVFLLPGANALDVAHKVRQALDEMKKTFPPGLDYATPFNTTVFVEEAIHEVYNTLFEAGVLVLIVILLFLQDWRAVLIPATTVPVTIIGAFAAMAALGFSINMLTLFGLVLAIGIVVDDAIVIVENAAHHIDRGLPPREATITAMSEVLGPIIGITLVLMAVFLPTAFLGGITGQLYRQFALTIAATAIISAVNAVTLKPAQCAVYLRPTRTRKNFFYRGFNKVYEWCEAIYTAIIRRLVRHPVFMSLLFVGLVGFTGWWFTKLPTGFLPTEDMGYAVIGVQLPDAASQTRTQEVVARINKILMETPGVAHATTIGGMSVLDQSNSSNAAAFYVNWTPWSERKDPSLSQTALLTTLRQKFSEIKEANVFIFPPPAIFGLGVTGGFQMQLEDRAGAGLEELQKLVDEIVQDGNAQSGLQALNSTFRANVPQLYVDIDRTKARTLNIPLDTVFGTLQAYMGSAYVNDFNKFGRTYQVRVQADQKFRMSAEDIRQLEVRTRDGKMVPLRTFVDIREIVGPQVIPRYNMYPTATITGEAAAGFSSGQALTMMEDMAANKLSASFGFDWTGMSFQEKRVGSQAFWVFLLAVVMVYLVLAAQYESWFTPAAVILVVPLALLGTVAAVMFRGMDNNIYTQIGIVLIIALASKNAILIVEFARELRLKGENIVEAAVGAARLRFRPILMTSFAFILGIYPLVVATGAGATSRRALGTAVFGGMVAGTVLAVFFVPVFFVIVQRFNEWWKPLNAEAMPFDELHARH